MALVDPPEPLRVQDLGIPPSLVLDITLRRAMREGQTNTLRLADTLCVSPVLLEQVIEKLRHDRLVEINGIEGRSYILTLSEPGRVQATERMAVSKYAGAVPVSLDEYARVVNAQHVRPQVNRELIRRAFSDLVIGDSLLDELGPSIHSPGAIFLYGPPGTGKSSIAERLVRANDDSVLVPRAVEIDGQVIMVFDPVVHEPINPQPDRLDRRWFRCKRPSIVVGGELSAMQLDLNYQGHAGVYLAPLQMQANNGVLVIDDFGRQALTPEQLLNRWIVPLDRDVDYLKLDYGVKFEVPFLTKIVFATNLPPSSLADEAFFRRIGSKILIPPINDDAFDEVLRRVSADRKISVTPEAFAHMRAGSRDKGDGDLRPYLPGAICTLVRSISEYEGTDPVLDPLTIDRALALYFSRDRDMTQPSLEAIIAAPENRPSSADAALEATDELLWVTSAEDVRRVALRLVDRLGGSYVTGDEHGVETLPVDLSFGTGEVTRPVAPDDPERRKELEAHLHRFAINAERALALAGGERLMVDELLIDPITGLPTDQDMSRLVGRLGDEDVVVALHLDNFDQTHDEAGRKRVLAEFGSLLRAEVRARDRAAYYGGGKFLVIILSGVEQDPESLLARLQKGWADARSEPVTFSAGFALAGPNSRLALSAADHALLRAEAAGGDGWVQADPADYE